MKLTDVFSKLVLEGKKTAVGRKLVTVVDAPNNLISINRQNPLTAGVVAEGAEYPSDDNDDTSVSVSTYKLGLTVKIPVEWMEDNEYEFIKGKIEAGVRAIYRMEDKLIFDELISQAGNTVIQGPTYEEFIFIEDINQAIEYIEAAGYEADRIVLNPEQARKYRNNCDIDFDALGRRRKWAYERHVLVSDLIPDGTALVMNSTDCCLLAVRRPMTRRMDNTSILDVIQYAISERVAPIVVRSDLVCKITGL